MPTYNSGMLQTTAPLVSKEAFHGIVWTTFALCAVTFSFRAYVRMVCFRRLYVDDWLMVGALAIALAANILCQLGLGYVYNIADPDFIPGPDFLSDTQTGLREFGVAMILSYIGIWLIKLNFLLFFYRLGGRVRHFRIFWWVVLALTMACGVTELGIMQTKCMFGPVMYIVTTCNLPSSLQESYTRFKVSCILDIVTDAMIIGFPISVIWGVQISFRQKVALAGIFALVIFTIVVTIIRGSSFGGIYQPFDANNLRGMKHFLDLVLVRDGIPSYIIACLVSFRALFTKQERRALKQEILPMPALPPGQPGAVKGSKLKFMSRVKLIQNSVLDTCRTLEGTRSDGNDDYALPIPPPGRMSVNFLNFPAPKIQPVTTQISSSSSGYWANLTNSSTLTCDSDAAARAV